MAKTVSSFKESISSSQRVRERLLNNITSQSDKEINLNLSDLDFDFHRQEVRISYYIKDNDYPDVVMKFDDFVSLVQS